MKPQPEMRLYKLHKYKTKIGEWAEPEQAWIEQSLRAWMNGSKPTTVSRDLPYVQEKASSVNTITEQLRKEEFIITPEPTSGVVRYDIGRLASNLPCEDDYAHAVISDPLNLGKGTDWRVWGIFDGHV